MDYVETLGDGFVDIVLLSVRGRKLSATNSYTDIVREAMAQSGIGEDLTFTQPVYSPVIEADGKQYIVYLTPVYGSIDGYRYRQNPILCGVVYDVETLSGSLIPASYEAGDSLPFRRDRGFRRDAAADRGGRKRPPGDRGGRRFAVYRRGTVSDRAGDGGRAGMGTDLPGAGVGGGVRHRPDAQPGCDADPPDGAPVAGGDGRDSAGGPAGYREAQRRYCRAGTVSRPRPPAAMKELRPVSGC